MKTVLRASLSICALSGAAWAADMPNTPDGAPPPSLIAYDAYGSLAAGYNRWTVADGGRSQGLGLEGRASGFIPLFAGLGLQADGTFNRSEFRDENTLRRNTGAVTGHAFFRNGVGLIGVLVQASANDTTVVSSRDMMVGAEAQYYLGQATFYGQAVYQTYTINGAGARPDVSAHGWNMAGQFRYFLQPNWMVALKASYADLDFEKIGASLNHTAWKLGMKTEYKFANSPFSVFAEADQRHGRFRIAGVSAIRERETRLMIGAKWNFGAESLLQRDRAGASLDPLASLMTPAVIIIPAPRSPPPP